jgi:hypothetical protein
MDLLFHLGQKVEHLSSPILAVSAIWGRQGSPERGVS